MTQENKATLVKLAEKYPFINDVIYELDAYERIREHGLVKGYLTLIGQIDDMCDQLTIDGETIDRVVGEGELDETIKVKKGRIDLFADKDTKDFERGLKFLLELPKLNTAAKDMLAEMTGEQRVLANDIRKNKKQIELIERIAIT